MSHDVAPSARWLQSGSSDGEFKRADEGTTPATDGLTGTANRKIILDLSDLLDWLRHHAQVSGIQRVQVEIAAVVSGRIVDGFEYISAFRYGSEQQVRAVPNALIDGLISALRSGQVSRSQLNLMLERIGKAATPLATREGDVFFLLGAFWHIKGVARLLERLATEKVIIGAIIYDLIPIRNREFSDLGLIDHFTRTLQGVGPMLSFALTISDYVANDYAAFRREHGEPEVPIASLPLAVQLDRPSGGISLAPEIAERIGSNYVLQVGTIEVRKNPRYALEVWRQLVADGTPDLPKLVYVGRLGWRITDFLEELQASNFLDDRVIIVNGVGDGDLWALYAGARFTMFPSFTEGWGLPIGESLAHGVPCICSGAASLPEVGGDFADYIDPLNVRSGVAAVRRMLDDGYRNTRAQQIRDQFPLRQWVDVAERFHERLLDYLRTAIAVRIDPKRLPAGGLVSAGDLGHVDALVIAAGWYPAEDWGSWARESVASLSFFASTSDPIRVLLVLRTSPALENYKVRVTTSDGDILDERTIAVSGTRFLVSVDALPGDQGRVDICIKTVGPPPLPAEGDDRSLLMGLEAFGYAPRDDMRMRQDLLELVALDSFMVAPRRMKV